MPTQIILIRHGETDWNVDGRFQGQGAIPLNENGKNQAEQLGQYFADNPPRAQIMYCSDSLRTRQTADIINKYINLPITYEARVREVDVGQWQGMNSTEVEEWDAVRYQEFLADPFNNACPDGESYSQIAARGAEALNEIAQKHPNEQVLIVSHGALIRHTTLRLAPTAELKERTLNTSLTTLLCYTETSAWLFRSHSQTPHLVSSTE